MRSCLVWRVCPAVHEWSLIESTRLSHWCAADVPSRCAAGLQGAEKISMCRWSRGGRAAGSGWQPVEAEGLSSSASPGTVLLAAPEQLGGSSLHYSCAAFLGFWMQLEMGPSLLLRPFCNFWFGVWFSLLNVFATPPPQCCLYALPSVNTGAVPLSSSMVKPLASWLHFFFIFSDVTYFLLFSSLLY